MAVRFCSSCGSELVPGTSFCVACGVPIIQHDSEASSAVLKGFTPGEMVHQVAKWTPQILSLVGEKSDASPVGGEIICQQTLLAKPLPLFESLGPIQYVWSRFIQFFRGFKGAFKDKRRLIPALLLGFVWIAYALMRYFGIDNPVTYYMSLLTFAKGGLQGGPLEIVGGVLGKGIVAVVITGFFASLMALKNPFAGMFTSIKSFAHSLSLKSLSQFAPLLMGMGFALVVFNFMGGQVTPESIMVAIASLVITLRGLTAKTGFIKGLYAAVKGKKKKQTQAINWMGINRFIAGLSTGFAAAIGLTFTQMPYVCYMAGAVLIVLSALFAFVPQKNKEGAVI